jgi:hypothetical protein
LLDLRRIECRLAKFYSPAETRCWLYAKHPLLRGARAIDLIHQGHSAEVLTVIEGLEESTHT